MKKWLIYLFGSAIFLGILPGFFIEEEVKLTALFNALGYSNGSYGISSMKFAALSFTVFAFQSFVGFKAKEVKWFSLALIIPSLLMLLWSCIMFCSPTHIRVSEVAPAWYIFMMHILTMAFLGFKLEQKGRFPLYSKDNNKYREDILDDMTKSS